MCEPIALAAAAAASIGGSINRTLQGRANAKAANRFQQRLFELNEAEAEKTANVDFAALEARALEEAEAASSQIRQVALQGAQARARARVSAGEAGALGGNLAALLGDLGRQEAEFRIAVARRQTFVVRQLGREALTIRARQRSRTLSRLPQPIPLPSFLDLGFKIGGSIGKFGADLAKSKARADAARGD